ncbi:MAG: GH92 family glycosyl hydrolase [Cyclobacteriaceae bacterium]|nr:GH92 family glycosyl hydrolase [Cyclobacteriaceae bacterium]
MRNISILLTLSSALLFSCAKEIPFHPADYVDPNIGSVHGRWFFYTPAAMPFGMVKLAPHTNAYGSEGGWGPCGYDDRHTSIEGFGHFHEFQIGGLVVMPATGEHKTVPGNLDDPGSGYRSRYDKKDEIAEPGYYSVILKDYDVRAELTATERVAFHRYTFPASEKSNLIIDIGHRQGESSDVIEAMARMTGDREIEGHVITYPEYVKFCDPGNRVKMFFVARLNTSPDHTGIFIDTIYEAGKRETLGINNGLILSFSTGESEMIEMQVGLSYTSINNARNNLEKEATGLVFDQVRENARKAWNKKLGRIRVEGGREEDRVKFYTGLYHALLGRGISSDVNGQYPMNDGSIGQIPLDENGRPLYCHYNTDGIWGAFWNLGLLWPLAYPDFFNDYLQSNIDFYKETGWLHDGEAAGTYTNGVQTNYMGLMLAAAYACGIRNFDVETAYEAARKNELGYRDRPFGSGKYDLAHFISLGYIPLKDTLLSNGWVFNFGTSHMLEYCFSSYAVAQFATAMDKKEDYDRLIRQATYYRNVFNPENKFITPREMDGSFMQDFDPMVPWKGFQEGNGFQYTWYVPHDVNGLIGLMGRDLFNERLDMMFTEARKSGFGGGKEIHSFSGLEKLYNHGNQPCLHNAWLYNYSGKPWQTQQWTRNILNEFYGTTALHGYGYGQDEDQGQLGAWYVMASMGLFDVQGHTAANPTFQIGSPLFDRIEIWLDPDYYSGGKAVIEVLNNSPENRYVQAAYLNDRPLVNCWFYRKDLMDGGRLTLEMGPEPNERWGVEFPPPSMSDE